MKGVGHPDEVVARAKAAMCLGMTVKAVCRHLGLPYTIAREWKYGKRRPDVPADAATKAAILRALKG